MKRKTTLIILAIITGIQGFYWIYKTRSVDFYESQPMSRKERFWQIYVNGILLYCVPMLVMCASAIM